MRLLLVFLCIPILVFSQHSDLPKHPQPGKCYLRSPIENGFTDWKAVNCNLIKFYIELPINFDAYLDEFSEKDKKTIEKNLTKLLKKGYKLEIAVNYDSKASDSINALRSFERADVLAKYLASQEIDPNLLSMKSYGNSQAAKRCNENINCSKIYKENSKLGYKVIGFYGKNFYFDEERNAWRKRKK